MVSWSSRGGGMSICCSVLEGTDILSHLSVGAAKCMLLYYFNSIIILTMIAYDYETLIRMGKWSTHSFMHFPADSATWPIEIFKRKHRSKHWGKGGGVKHQLQPWSHRQARPSLCPSLHPSQHWRKHQGKRGEIKHRLRARTQGSSLPSILLVTVQAVDNKLEDLCAHIRFQRVLYSTKIWLNPGRKQENKTSLPEWLPPSGTHFYSDEMLWVAGQRLHLSSLPRTLDPLQLAYSPNQSMDDAIAILHTILSHLDKRGSYVRLLFIDYSSAFNTIVPSRLITKLKDLGLNTSLCKWVLDFLAGRSQVVWMGGHTSSALILNTGAPRGCVLSPLLYFLYTHDCAATFDSNTIVKFADDTAVVGLITDNNEKAYLKEVEGLTRWCQDNNLLLNVSKTKELMEGQHPP